VFVDQVTGTCREFKSVVNDLCNEFKTMELQVLSSIFRFNDMIVAEDLLFV